MTAILRPFLCLCAAMVFLVVVRQVRNLLNVGIHYLGLRVLFRICYSVG